MLGEIYRVILPLAGSIIGRWIASSDLSNIWQPGPDEPQAEQTTNFKRNFGKDVKLVLLSTACTYVYFLYADSYAGPSLWLLLVNYSVGFVIFISIIDDDFSIPAPLPSRDVLSVHAVPLLLMASSILLVSGWFPVFGVGTLGGIAAEVFILYRKRSSLPKFKPSYWIITAAAILVGGVLTTFYGIQNENALTVLQVGATAPLIFSKLR